MVAILGCSIVPILDEARVRPSSNTTRNIRSKRGEENPSHKCQIFDPRCATEASGYIVASSKVDWGQNVRAHSTYCSNGL